MTTKLPRQPDIYWVELMDNEGFPIHAALSRHVGPKGETCYHRIIENFDTGGDWALDSSPEILTKHDRGLLWDDLDDAKAYCQKREEEIAAGCPGSLPTPMPTD